MAQEYLTQQDYVRRGMLILRELGHLREADCIEQELYDREAMEEKIRKLQDEVKWWKKLHFTLVEYNKDED